MVEGGADARDYDGGGVGGVKGEREVTARLNLPRRVFIYWEDKSDVSQDLSPV